MNDTSVPVSSRILLLSLVAMGMGQTVVFAVLPMLGRTLLEPITGQIGPWQWILPVELMTNLLTAISALMYFLVSPKWGRFSDRRGRKTVVLIGLLGYTAGTLLFNTTAWLGFDGVLSGIALFAALFITRGIHASIMSATQPAAMAFVADTTTPQQRTKGMSQMAAANGLGTMMGPALTVVAGFSLLAPMFVQAAITLMAAIAVALWMKESPSHGKRPPLGKKLRYLDTRYRDFLLVGLVMYTMMSIVQQTLGYYFQDVLQLDATSTAQYYGGAMVVSSGMMLLAQLVLVQRFSWLPLTLLKLGLPITVLGYGLLALADNYVVMVVAMGLFGLGMGLAAPGYSAGATLRVGPEEQGALAGLVSAAPGLGFVIGPVIGGTLYAMSPSYPYLVAAIILIPLILYVLKLKH